MGLFESRINGVIYFGIACTNGRHLRIQLDRVPQHIVQRGHNREACFLGEEDYASFLHWLGEALAETECRLYANALMTNRVGLLLTPKEATTAPRLNTLLGRSYVQYINRPHHRTGTLWEKRGQYS